MCLEEGFLDGEVVEVTKVAGVGAGARGIGSSAGI